MKFAFNTYFIYYAVYYTHVVDRLGTRLWHYHVSCRWPISYNWKFWNNTVIVPCIQNLVHNKFETVRFLKGLWHAKDHCMKQPFHLYLYILKKMRRASAMEQAKSTWKKDRIVAPDMSRNKCSLQNVQWLLSSAWVCGHDTQLKCWWGSMCTQCCPKSYTYDRQSQSGLISARLSWNCTFHRQGVRGKMDMQIHTP